MNPINFSVHAREQMLERGATEQEVIEAIFNGEKVPAKKDRSSYRLNFEYNKVWADKLYSMKQVMPVVKEELAQTIVITVYVFYF